MTITLSPSPSVPSVVNAHGASAPYASAGIGQDLHVVLSPGTDDTLLAVCLSTATVSTGTIAALANLPAGVQLVGIVDASRTLAMVGDEYTRANAHVFVVRLRGSTAATVAITGEAAASGTAGSTGATGPAGTTGAAGSTGATGSVGATGPTGSTGSAGATGSSGVAGATGSAGTAGATGAAGSTGATGASGTVGATGAAGSAGATGATGATGSVGATGSAGATGAAGATGSVGATGATGSAGATGATGAAGATGAQGATGPTGSTGSTGATGAVGATGAQGPGTTELGTAVLGGTATSNGTPTDILSLTLSLAGSTRVRVVAPCRYSASLAGAVTVSLLMDGSTVDTTLQNLALGANGSAALIGEATLAAGSRIVKVQGSVALGTVTFAANAVHIFVDLVTP